jgi:hypothetical protein
MHSSHRTKRFLDRYVLRGGAALLAGAALGGAVYRLPALLRAGHRYMKQPDRSVAAADLDPVRYFAQIGVVLAARGAIPAGSTYTVALGRYVAPSTTIILREELLPLRYTPKLRDAQYVIAYDRDPKTIGVRYTRSVDLTWPARLLEVKR